MPKLNKISDSTFTIVANGYADGPAQPLRDYLIQKGAKRVVTVFHPLVPESGNQHIVSVYSHDKEAHSITRLPNKPPYTYLFDPFVPLRLPASTVWFGFNNLACLRGLVRRRTGRTQEVYYWAVDFVPQRFGPGLATKVYNYTDRLVSTRANARIELSRAALDGRSQYLKLPKNAAPGLIAPMGSWLGRAPKSRADAWRKRTIVYMGHLVERQGVATLIQAIAILNRKKPSVSADIIGSGPLEEELKKLAKDLDAKNITFHGFVKDYEDVEKLLGAASVAAAPYVKDDKNFTQFADPGKLKAYLGAGLPTVLTDVPPNAAELQASGAALIVDDNPQSMADGLEKMLDEKTWSKAHKDALEYAKQFDWNHILGKTLESLGFE